MPAGWAADERQGGKCRVGKPGLFRLEVAEREGGTSPAVEPQRGLPAHGGVQQDLVGGHVVRAIADLVGQQPDGQLFHRRIGSLAARTSSGRLRPSVCGASCKKSVSSSRIFNSVSAKASS